MFVHPFVSCGKFREINSSKGDQTVGKKYLQLLSLAEKIVEKLDGLIWSLWNALMIEMVK